MFGRFNKMHRKAVATSAERLAVQIEALKSDKSLESTFALLDSLINDARNGRLRKPPKFFPCSSAHFTQFESYPELENAFAVFHLVASVSDYGLIRDIVERNELVD